MALLRLEALPPGVTRGGILAFVVEHGGIAAGRVGAIELATGQATVELPDDRWAQRVARALDGQALDERPVRAWAQRPTARGDDDEDPFERLIALIELESQAQMERLRDEIAGLDAAAAERAGRALLGLEPADVSGALGGRARVRLARRGGAELPWTMLRTGSPILLSADEQTSWSGVVERRERTAITVVLNHWPEFEDGPRLRLDLATDDVAWRRARSALEQVRAASPGPLAALRDVLIGAAPPRFPAPLRDAIDYQPLDDGLDPSQRAAVAFCLSAQDCAIIHGPPGTGKTRTAVEYIRQCVARGETVLACAPSNLAVDHVLGRLLAAGEPALRLGHPARIQPELLAHSLDARIAQHQDVKRAHKLVREADALRHKADKEGRGRPPAGERAALRREARTLRDDARRMEVQAVQQVLDGARVLCATLAGVDGSILGARHFDVAVIDEACQADEPATWIPLLRCRRVIFAGDPFQLPPTVISPQAAEGGLALSLPERLMDRYGQRGISRRLSVQYRMHADIAAYSAKAFYDGALFADISVREHLLADLPGVAAQALTTTPVEFIDTAGADHEEQSEPGGESRINAGEAELALRRVRALLAAGLGAEDIAVIAPYAAQVRLLRERSPDPAVDINSVDGFQGREKEAVIISLVRSNPDGQIGFLADVRRMNVALTRARRKLIVIGDSACLSSHPFYAGMIEHFQKTGAYRTVWEEDQT